MIHAQVQNRVGMHWRDESTLVVDEVTFVARTTDRFESGDDRFCLVKRPDLVDRYIDLLAELEPKLIVELGIFQGGSTALLALLADPDLLLAFDRSPDGLESLGEFLSNRGLSDRVHPYWGVDQGRLREMAPVLDAHLAGRPLDLVIDDASHLLGPTRHSFDVLFPRLRPGGMFVLEDWAWAHVGYGLAHPEEVPLSALAFEFMLALPSAPGLIADIRVDRDWVVVVRGDADIDPDTFDISATYGQRGRDLLVPLAKDR